jgi:hypothetical protein
MCRGRGDSRLVRHHPGPPAPPRLIRDLVPRRDDLPGGSRPPGHGVDRGHAASRSQRPGRRALRCSRWRPGPAGSAPLPAGHRALEPFTVGAPGHRAWQPAGPRPGPGGGAARRGVRVAPRCRVTGLAHHPGRCRHPSPVLGLRRLAVLRSRGGCLVTPVPRPPAGRPAGRAGVQCSNPVARRRADRLVLLRLRGHARAPRRGVGSSTEGDLRHSRGTRARRALPVS